MERMTFKYIVWPRRVVCYAVVANEKVARSIVSAFNGHGVHAGVMYSADPTQPGKENRKGVVFFLCDYFKTARWETKTLAESVGSFHARAVALGYEFSKATESARWCWIDNLRSIVHADPSTGDGRSIEAVLEGRDLPPVPELEPKAAS